MASKKKANLDFTTGMTIATVQNKRTSRGRRTTVAVPLVLETHPAPSGKRKRALKDSIQEINAKKSKIDPGASGTSSKKFQGMKQGKVSLYFKVVWLDSSPVLIQAFVEPQ